METKKVLLRRILIQLGDNEDTLNQIESSCFNINHKLTKRRAKRPINFTKSENELGLALQQKILKYDWMIVKFAPNILYVNNHGYGSYFIARNNNLVCDGSINYHVLQLSLSYWNRLRDIKNKLDNK